MNTPGFVNFLCPKCQSEIEATDDLVGTETECPACGEHLIVPAAPEQDDGVARHGAAEMRNVRNEAMKSRTIRIDLGDDL